MTARSRRAVVREDEPVAPVKVVRRPVSIADAILGVANVVAGVAETLEAIEAGGSLPDAVRRAVKRGRARARGAKKAERAKGSE